MADVPHGNLVPGSLSGVHIPLRWPAFASEAALLAQAVTTADESGFAFASDTKTLWFLANHVGPVWQKIGNAKGFTGVRVVSGDDIPTSADAGKLLIISAATASQQTINAALALGPGDAITYFVRGDGVPTFVESSTTLIPPPGKGKVSLGKGSWHQLVGLDIASTFALGGNFEDASGGGPTYPGADPWDVANLFEDWDPGAVGAVDAGGTWSLTDAKSGHVRSQATTLLKPALVSADANFNGQNSVAYVTTGGPDYTVSGQPSTDYSFFHDGTSGWTYFCVGRVNSGNFQTLNTLFATAEASSPSGQKGVRFTAKGHYISNGTLSISGPGPLGSGSTLALGQSFVICYSWDGTIGTNKVAQRCVPGQDAWVYANTSNTIVTGAPTGTETDGAIPSASRALDGWKARELVFKRALTQTECDDIITHLAAKYLGITP